VGTVRILLARASRGTRAWLLLGVSLGIVGRVLLVVLAHRVTTGAAETAVAIGVASTLVFTASRVVQSFSRASVQSDVHAMSARAILTGDVVSVPTEDVRRVVLDGTYHSVQLLAQLASALVADVVASLLILPVVVSTFSLRLVVLAAAALVVVMLVATAVRALAYRLEQRVADLYAEVFDRLLGTIESRVEIVARAGEDELLRSFGRQLKEYESHVRRLGLGSALLGRAPLAAGALAVVLVVLLDGGSRAALEGAALTQALVLAACAPLFHGAILGAHGMVRSLVFVRPLMAMVEEAQDLAAARKGATIDLPVLVRADGVSFSYAEDAAPVLRDVSFVWRPGEPLVLVGPNGSGKSTLFRLLLGLRAPSTGSIRYGDHDLASIDVSSVRRQTAYLPQRPYLGEVYGSVRAALRLAVPSASDEAMREALARVEVLDALGKNGDEALATPVGELSAGQRQRVGLARVLLHDDARMFLLDEPDANLDAAGVLMVASIVKTLAREGRMVAIAAHTPELAALSSTPVDFRKGPGSVALRSVGA